MTIETILGINDYTLLVYSGSDKTYYFSMINEKGKAYTCESGFPSFSNAKFMGISAIEKAVIDRDRKKK